MRRCFNRVSKTTFLVLCVVSGLFIYGGNQYISSVQLKHDGEMKYIDYNEGETEMAVEYGVTTQSNVQSRPDKKDAVCYTQTAVFQSSEDAEFPSSNNSLPKIPHKIHQICDSEFVLDVFVEPMQSFIANNPKWEHWFWTYKAGRRLLKDHYPYLLDIYDSFRDNGKRGDLLRYAIIHAFGGVYADLDVRNVRPLDKATMKYACIISPEPFEHSSFIYTLNLVLSSSVLLCRPGHPFLKQVLLNLQLAQSDTGPVETTGPLYLTRIYLLYNDLTESLLNKPKADNATNSPYFYKGSRPEESDDAVYIPNSQYFMDNVDPLLMENGIFKPCEYLQSNILYKYNHTKLLHQRGCFEFECRKAIRKSKRFTFTVHYWYHLWTMLEFIKDSLKKVHINNVFKKYKFY